MTPAQKRLAKILFPATLALILLGSYFNATLYQYRAALALIAGAVLALIVTNPYENWTRKHVSTLLSLSVVGLGFGVNLIAIAKVGAEGIGYTIISILFCLVTGLGLGYFLKNDRNVSVLLSCGTAICGGSAIAALSPVIQAKAHEISLSLIIVFLLNALALLVFPWIGYYLQLTQEQFGLWSALAIHDTSSVVGATLQYGQKAVEVGTTVKLARALWIVPMTLLTAFLYQHFVFARGESSGKQTIKKPWFILGFLAAAALVTFFPVLKTPGLYLRTLAEQGLVAALFCIGSNLSQTSLSHMGIKPLIQGFVLWVLMAVFTLMFVSGMPA